MSSKHNMRVTVRVKNPEGGWDALRIIEMHVPDGKRHLVAEAIADNALAHHEWGYATTTTKERDNGTP